MPPATSYDFAGSASPPAHGHGMPSVSNSTASSPKSACDGIDAMDAGEGSAATPSSPCSHAQEAWQVMGSVPTSPDISISMSAASSAAGLEDGDPHAQQLSSDGRLSRSATPSPASSPARPTTACDVLTGDGPGVAALPAAESSAEFHSPGAAVEATCSTADNTDGEKYT